MRRRRGSSQAGPRGLYNPGRSFYACTRVALTEEQLAQDLTAAMKARDAQRVAVLRGVVAAAKHLKVERRVPQLEEADLVQVSGARSASATRPRSSPCKAGRDDLVDAEPGRARASSRATCRRSSARDELEQRDPRRPRRRQRAAARRGDDGAARALPGPRRWQGGERAGAQDPRRARRRLSATTMELPVLAKLKKELADLKHELTVRAPQGAGGRRGARRSVGERRVRGREAPAGLRALAHRAARGPHPRAVDVHGRVDPARRRRVRQPREARRRGRRYRRADRLRDRLPRGGRRRRAGRSPCRRRSAARS